MKPGEVRYVWYPFSKHETDTFKRRPVLVLGVRGQPGARDRVILMAMITSSAARLAAPARSDVLIPNWQAAGLMRRSLVRAHRIWTTDDRDFTGTALGVVDAAVLQQVWHCVLALVPPGIARPVNGATPT